MQRTLDNTIDITAPTERVWELVSTGPGLSSWFVNAEVQPGPEGRVTLRFAPGAEGTVPILIWDPPRQIRFGVPGGRVCDIVISATAGGSAVRLQDEGVDGAEAEAVAFGWNGFLGRLKALAEDGS